MKKNQVYDTVNLQAWNPVSKKLEPMMIRSNLPYRVEMESGDTYIYIFELSKKIEKKIKRVFHNDHPDILPYIYRWDGVGQYFDEEVGVIDVQRLKHLTPLCFRFIPSFNVKATSNAKSVVVLREFICKGEKFVVNINAPVRVSIKGLHGNMPETWYGTMAEYKPPKMFGGNTITVRTYNDDRTMPFVLDRKVSLNKVEAICNGDFSITRSTK